MSLHENVTGLFIHRNGSFHQNLQEYLPTGISSDGKSKRFCLLARKFNNWHKYWWSKSYDNKNKLLHLWCNTGFHFIAEIITKYTGLFTQRKDSGSTSGGWLHIGTVSSMWWWCVYANRNQSFKQNEGLEGDNVSTLPQWSVAATRRKSFHQIDGQIENIRRNSFYFAMMIRSCKQMRVLQTNWWTGQEPEEKLFLLCDDDLLLLMDLRPSRTFKDRWRTKEETVSTLRWWSVAADGSPSFKDI